MASGIYTFRVESFTLDQQVSTYNDTLILSVFYKIDDVNTKLCCSVPIACRVGSGYTVDLGRWAESEPIEVAEDSLITLIYQVVNITGGWSGPFDAVTSELNSQILPPLDAITSLADINVSTYTNVIFGALSFIYNTSSVPDCSGLVHLNSDQYLGARLAELTADFAVHRVANKPSMPLNPPASGCNTPASRISIAVEAVPARLAAAGLVKSSNRSIVVTRTMPLGATSAFTFDATDPTKFVAPEFILNQAVKGNVSCVVPAEGSDGAVSPVHLYALANSDGSILHALLDGSGWQDWKQISTEAGFGSLVAFAPKSSVDLFVIDARGALMHSAVAVNGTLPAFSGAPAGPNPGLDYSAGFEVNENDLKVWGHNVRLTGLWTQGSGYTLYAGLPPTGMEGYGVSGGLVLNATFKEPSTWGINWPYNDPEFPSFMMLGPDAITVTNYPGQGPANFSIGHNGQVLSNVAFANAEAGSKVDILLGTNPFRWLASPAAAQVTTALNTKTNTLWVAFTGTDQQVWVGAYLIGEKKWFPVNGNYMSLGGPFSGCPVIVPDPSGDTSRTFFFALGLDSNVYWKYFDGVADESFTPAGNQWASLPDKNNKVTLTGPLDSGPVVDVVNDPTKVLSNLPSLSVSYTRVAPGASISVVGGNFPLSSATELQLQWANTSSGKPTGAQIKYEIKGKTAATTIDVPVPHTGYGSYTYTAKSLVANTEYEFWARCSNSVGWSAWSRVPFTITTTKSANVQLVLQSLNHPTTTVVLGNKDLSATSQQWKLSATIPQATAVGPYTLAAKLDGGPLASANVTVATTALALLQIIDSKTNQVLAMPLLACGLTFTVRGLSFPNGPVSLGIEGVKVASTTATNGGFVATLKVPGSPGTAFEFMTVRASGNGVSASVEFTGPSPLK